MSETSKLYIPEGSDAVFQANLDAAGAYADNLEKGFSKFPEKVIPIDNDIRVVGIKSPIYLIILGFSTLNVLKAIRKLKKQIDYVLIIEDAEDILASRENGTNSAVSNLLNITDGIESSDLKFM